MASDEQRTAICNGCGAKGGVNFPDTMYGLDISEACHVHDWMTEYGKTLMDFLFAAGMFIVNLTIIIWFGSSNKLLLTLRLFRATKYFVAVVVFGLEHFYENKTRSQEAYISYKGSFK